jgi:hypothetical protein
MANAATFVDLVETGQRQNGLKRVRAWAIAVGRRRAELRAEPQSMRIKVYGGTVPNDGDSLCDTCRNSRITRGRRIDEEMVFCEASHLRTTRITFKVTSCSEYSDHRHPSCFELMQQAWILQPASRKQPAGFVRASDLREEEFSKFMADLREHEDL